MRLIGTPKKSLYQENRKVLMLSIKLSLLLPDDAMGVGGKPLSKNVAYFLVMSVRLCFCRTLSTEDSGQKLGDGQSEAMTHAAPIL